MMADRRVVEEVGRNISSADSQGRWTLPNLSVKTDVNEDKGKMTTSSSVDLSNQEVEELVRRLTMNEMSKKWLIDEIVSKVKTELVESPQAKSPANSEPSSPQPTVAQPQPPRFNKLYQATVEDATDSQAEIDGPKASKSRSEHVQGSRKTGRNVVHNCSPPSSDESETESSKVSNPLSSTTAMNTEALHTPPESPEPSPKSRPTVRFSDRVPVVLHNRPAPQPRHSAPNISRPVVTSESDGKMAMSTVDMKWGKLFDERCEPTPRLYSFLKGVGKYIAAEYNPKDSMVVTPEKLLTFYSKYKVESEAYPFQNIFDIKNRSKFLDNLEDLYYDLQCQYYLVQSRPDSKSQPYLPGLTPLGFADWMIQHIQAFPDQEARRLGRIVEELPIEADGTSERLPKQLSRYLLPAERQRKVHERVVRAGNSWLRSAGYSETSRRRDSHEKTYKDSRKSVDLGDRDVIVSRSTGEPERKSGHGSSGHRRKSRDGYSKSNERVYHRPAPSSRNMARSASEQIVRHPREVSPLPPPEPNYRHRESAPVNHYRTSVPALNIVTDGYSPSLGHHSNMASSYPGSTYSAGSVPGIGSLDRSLDYAANYVNAAASKTANTPRAMKRHSLAIPGRSSDNLGPTYDQYMRSSPRTSRNAGIDDENAYHQYGREMNKVYT